MKGHCSACQLIVYFFIWIESASARDPAQRRFVRPSIDKTDDAMNYLNSSHASSRDRKYASERDFRGGGLARQTQTFLFLFSL